jgi:uncharacterized protein (TIGR02453 family)
MVQVSLVPAITKSSFPGFSPDALAFLRALKRNNRREWFQPRKQKYESLIKAPMCELVECLNHELARFAPHYITPPQKAVYRIYRDTRFAKDKTPYKTHISAIFPRSNAVKREGAVFYFHFTEKELLVFGGVWNPERDELLAYRGHIQENHEELEAILREPRLRRAFGTLQGEKLSRMPKGFPVEHPAEGLLRQRQWYLEHTMDVQAVCSSRLPQELAKRFELMTPFLEFMNRPFVRKPAAKRMMMFGF